MRKVILAIGIAILGCASSADALCIYNGRHFEKSASKEFNGRLYAKTTLADEFLDSALVIRATVLSSRNIRNPEGDDWGTVYRVRVGQVFKGTAPKIIQYVSNRDSGGFYLGEGGESREYLLFLIAVPRGDWKNSKAPAAYEVNYSCGQSRQWRQVWGVDQDRLKELNARANSN